MESYDLSMSTPVSSCFKLAHMTRYAGKQLYVWWILVVFTFIQTLSNVQVSPDGKLIAGVTERGNVLLHDVSTLTQDLHRVCSQ